MRFRFVASVLKSAAGGAMMTLSSTAVACVGALFVERTAHRTLFRIFPHWYRDVDQAFGIEPHKLAAVRATKSESTTTVKGQSTMFADSERIERDITYNDTATSSHNMFNVVSHAAA